MKNAPILKVEGITKKFGGITAVENVNFEVFRGDIIGIIGPNGAGKSTLVNIITGFVKPDSGKVYFKGNDITNLSHYKIANLGIARTFQTPRTFYHLPAYKNIIVPLMSNRLKQFGRKYGDKDFVAIDLLEEVGFERDSSVPYKPASALPHGYLKRLELAKALALDPEVLILDELFSGLSVAEVASIIPLIEKIQQKGVTILMVEHRIRDLFKLANRVIVLQFGKKIAEGSPSEIVNNDRVREAYLGTEEI